MQRTLTAAVICMGVLLNAVDSAANSTVIQSGDDDALSASATNYHPVFGATDSFTGWVTTEANVRDILSPAGTLSKLYIQLTGTPGTGQSYIFTVYQNGSPTSLACTVADTATTCNDTAHSVTITAGDQMSLESVPVSTPTARKAIWTLDFNSTTSGETPWGFTNTQSADTNYNGMMGYNDSETTQRDPESIVPVAGTVQNLYIGLKTAPGAGKCKTFTLQQNITNTALTCSVCDTNTTCNDTTHPISVSAGDSLLTVSTMTAGSAGSILYGGYTFVPTTAGQFVSTVSSDSGISGSGSTDYLNVSGQDVNVNSSEAIAYSLSLAQTAKTIYAKLSGPPSAGQSYTITLMVAGSPSSLTCTISDSATTCNGSSDVTITDAQTVDIRIVASATASTGWKPRMGVLGYVAPPPSARRVLYVN